MSDFSSALEELNARKNSQDNKDVSAIFDELEILTVKSEGWPSGFFEELVKLLGDELYLKLKGSWTLLYFINGNWEELSATQRQELRDPLTSAFDKYENWMGAFVTSEILGERYADEGALSALVKFGNCAHLPARALVPHGLETLAKTTPDQSLRKLAIDQLRELEKSQSQEVRQEAQISLKKLGL